MGLPDQCFYCGNFGNSIINCLKKTKQQANVVVEKGSHKTDTHEIRVQESERQ